MVNRPEHPPLIDLAAIKEASCDSGQLGEPPLQDPEKKRVGPMVPVCIVERDPHDTNHGR